MSIVECKQNGQGQFRLNSKGLQAKYDGSVECRHPTYHSFKTLYKFWNIIPLNRRINPKLAVFAKNTQKKSQKGNLLA